MSTTNIENEVKLWLKLALSQENLENFSVQITGGTEKGDGFMGDIIFVIVTGNDKSGSIKCYNLVIKCSKTSAALLEKSPAMRESFVRESYLYEKILPTFKQFEIEREITEPFDSVPKLHGVYGDQQRHVIILENMKKLDYHLWNNKLPLTRRHIDLVMENYAHFHACSIALQEQNPEKFQELINGMSDDVLLNILDTIDFIKVLMDNIDDMCKVLKNELSEDILKIWSNTKHHIRSIFYDLTPRDDDLQVIVHGDCWNNNYLFKHADEAKSIVEKVVMLDWQLSKYGSPIIDLSYFLFSCLSEEDMLDMNTILGHYYKRFVNYLERMGSSFANKYPFEKLLREWKKFSRYGVMICLLTIKLAHTEKQDRPDMAKSADQGEDISSGFVVKVTDLIGYKNRIKPLVKYAVENELVLQ